MNKPSILPLTLCMFYQHPRILLGLKKRRFGTGRWNGFGGKLLEGETMEQSLVRELDEEVGLVPKDLEKRGIISFEFENDPVILEVHIYRCTQWDGEPIESEEMTPKWFSIDEIPYDQMWPDDIHWLPLFLEGKKFTGTFLFDKPSDATYTSKILKQQLQEVESLN